MSNRWLAFGVSQGGQASWAVNEQNRFYGDGLELLGSVAMAPAANMSAMADMAYREALTAQQLLIVPSLAIGVDRSYPSAPIGDFLHGEADRDATWSSIVDRPPTRRARRSPHRTSSRTARPMPPRSPIRCVRCPCRWRRFRHRCWWSADGGRAVLPQWVNESVDRACRLGGQIEHIELPDAAHGDVGPNEQSTRWMADRFGRGAGAQHLPGQPMSSPATGPSELGGRFRLAALSGRGYDKDRRWRFRCCGCWSRGGHDALVVPNRLRTFILRRFGHRSPGRFDQA